MKSQEQAARLVQHEVYQCVSLLVSGLAQIAHQLDYRTFGDAFGIDQDELMDLCQRPNFEEAARQFIKDDADIDDLESIADRFGRWEDILAWSNVPKVVAVSEDRWGYTGCTDTFDDEDEATTAAIESVTEAIREQVLAIVTTQDEYQTICNEHGLDYEYNEAYEHWAVSDWLASKLAAEGEITGEVAGITVWGRCCSGQSISMDSVIQEIATSLWGNE